VAIQQQEQQWAQQWRARFDGLSKALKQKGPRGKEELSQIQSGKAILDDGSDIVPLRDLFKLPFENRKKEGAKILRAMREAQRGLAEEELASSKETQRIRRLEEAREESKKTSKKRRKAKKQSTQQQKSLEKQLEDDKNQGKISLVDYRRALIKHKKPIKVHPGIMKIEIPGTNEKLPIEWKVEEYASSVDDSGQGRDSSFIVVIREPFSRDFGDPSLPGHPLIKEKVWKNLEGANEAAREAIKTTMRAYRLSGKTPKKIGRRTKEKIAEDRENLDRWKTARPKNEALQKIYGVKKSSFKEIEDAANEQSIHPDVRTLLEYRSKLENEIKAGIRRSDITTREVAEEMMQVHQYLGEIFPDVRVRKATGVRDKAGKRKIIPTRLLADRLNQLAQAYKKLSGRPKELAKQRLESLQKQGVAGLNLGARAAMETVSGWRSLQPSKIELLLDSEINQAVFEKIERDAFDLKFGENHPGYKKLVRYRNRLKGYIRDNRIPRGYTKNDLISDIRATDKYLSEVEADTEKFKEAKKRDTRSSKKPSKGRISLEKTLRRGGAKQLKSGRIQLDLKRRDDNPSKPPEDFSERLGRGFARMTKRMQGKGQSAKLSKQQQKDLEFFQEEVGRGAAKVVKSIRGQKSSGFYMKEGERIEREASRDFKRFVDFVGQGNADMALGMHALERLYLAYCNYKIEASRGNRQAKNRASEVYQKIQYSRNFIGAIGQISSSLIRKIYYSVDRYALTQLFGGSPGFDDTSGEVTDWYKFYGVKSRKQNPGSKDPIPLENPPKQTHEKNGNKFEKEGMEALGKYKKSNNIRSLIRAHQYLSLADQEFTYTGDKKQLERVAKNLTFVDEELRARCKR